MKTISKSKKAPKKTSVRLPAYVIPLRYEIKLKPDLEAAVFQGEETISLQLTKATKTLVLHANEISVESAEVLVGKEKHVARDISYDNKLETVTFSFDKIIPVGKIKLHLTFSGILNELMHGFYRSHFEHEGKTHHLATTQFEATDARRAFPCFDEPAQKAIFDVSLIVPGDMTAISNTLPTLVEEHEAGFKIVHFAPTPKMSTYLLAFIVGHFEYVESTTKEGVTVRVYTTPGKKHQAGFALECAVKMLEFYNEYFDIPYPLNTLDMIAVPDFAAGAMENWGAVTYRESMLLVDPEQTSAITRQWVAVVIAHELAHQWFGNLVTMEWWTHLWLNEGFATYIEYLATDHVFPEWRIWDQFISNDAASALRLDALKTTHAIEIDVHDPSEIREIFDAISYAKGASVIRMLAEYLGETAFRDGLRHYLKKHSYKNTATEHLWEAFEKISKKPVQKMMAAWTRKGGYPYISLSQKNNILQIEQKRFYSSPLSETAEEKSKQNTTRWMVPLSFRFEGMGHNTSMLLDKAKATLPKEAGWVKGNMGETGVYRTLYSSELLSALQRPLASKELSTADRFGIIRDAFAFVEAGKMDIKDLFEVLESYKSETEYVVWSEIAGGLAKLYSLFYDMPWIASYKKFASSLYSPIVKEIGWEKKKDEAHATTLLRSLVLGQAGLFGHKEVIAEARRRFASLTENKNDIHPDLRGVVYSITARQGGPKEHATLRSHYISATLPEEKNRIAGAMTQFDSTAQLQKTLDFALSKNVRFQDATTIMGAVWANPAGRDLAWNFLKDNWKILNERYGGTPFMPRLLESGKTFTTKKQVGDFQKFFKKYSVPSAARTIEQVIEKALSNEAWVKRDQKKLPKLLQ